MWFGEIVFSSDEEKVDDLITLRFGRKNFIVIKGKRLTGAVAKISKNEVCRISPSRNRSGELGQDDWVREVTFGEEQEEKKEDADDGPA